MAEDCNCRNTMTFPAASECTKYGDPLERTVLREYRYRVYPQHPVPRCTFCPNLNAESREFGGSGMQDNTQPCGAPLVGKVWNAVSRRWESAWNYY